MFNSVARVKLVETKNLNVNKYRLVCAFNVTETFVNFLGFQTFKFPVQKKCNYVSGDFKIENLDAELARAVRYLKTDNIQLVKHLPATYEGDASKYTVVTADSFAR
jgi:hypothetical protein